MRGPKLGNQESLKQSTSADLFLVTIGLINQHASHCAIFVPCGKQQVGAQVSALE